MTNNVRKIDKIIILGLTLIAFWLRVYRLDHQSYWIDEAWSVYFGSLDIGVLWNLLRITEIKPPFYHPSTVYWIDVFGTSEFALRYYSVIFGVLVPPLIYRLGQALGDRRLGVIAALLMTIAPYQVWHSQDARFYSILTAAGLMSMWGFVMLWKEGGWRWWLVYIIGTEWAISTHYHGVFIIGVQGLFLLLTWRRHWRGYLWWGATLILMILIQVPWLLVGGELLANYINWLPQPGFFETFTRSVKAYSLNELVPNEQALWLALPFVVTYLIGLVYATRRHWADWHGSEMLAFLLAFTLAPNTAAWLYGVFRTPAYLERYLITVQIGYILAISIGILAIADGLPRFMGWLRSSKASAPPTRRGAVSPLAGGTKGGRTAQELARSIPSLTLASLVLLTLIAINGWVLYHHYTDPLYAKPDWRDIADTIAAHAQPGDAILLTGDGGEIAFDFYYDGDLPVHYDFNLLKPTEPDYKKGRPGIDNYEQVMTELATQYRRIWFSPYGVPDIDPQLEQWLADNSYPAWQGWIGRKRLALYHTEPPEENSDPLTATFTNGDSEAITLLEAQHPNNPVTAGDALPLHLIWQTDQTLAANYQLSLRLLNARGDIFTQSDWPPLTFDQPTTAWPAQQPISDPRSLWLPADVPPGDYNLQLVLYDSATGTPLGQPTLLPNVKITPAQTAPPLDYVALPNRMSQPLGPITLVGYAAPDALQPGQEMWLWLYWQLQGQLAVDASLQLSLQSDDTRIDHDLPLSDGVGEFDGWQVGQVRRMVAHLPTSPRLLGNEASLNIALTNGPAVAETTLTTIALNNRARNFDPPSIQTPLHITFGDPGKISLLGYDLSMTELQPGGQLPLTLYWQAQQEMQTAYTVFIQLLDQNQQVVTQIDAQPQGGSAPTTTWLPEEILTDEYTLTLPAELPRGQYQLIVGWYDGVTGQRLVVNGVDFMGLGTMSVE